MWFFDWLSTVPVDRRAAVLAEFKEVCAEMLALGWPLEEARRTAALAVHLPGGFRE